MPFQSSRSVEILQQDSSGKITWLLETFPHWEVSWAQLLDSGRSNASLAPVKNSLLFPKRFLSHHLVRPYAVLPGIHTSLYSFISHLSCACSGAAPARLDGPECWCSFHKGADYTVRWFVPDSTASRGQAGGGGGGNQGFQSLSAPPSQPHLWPSWAREAAETSTPLVTVTHFSALQGVRHHSKPPKSFCYWSWDGGD